MSEASIIEQQGNQSASRATGEFIKKQPIIALSGLGAAVTSVRGLMRQVRSMSPLKMIRPTQMKRLLPRYMKSNYVRYPAMLLLLLVSARKIRLMLNH